MAAGASIVFLPAIEALAEAPPQSPAAQPFE
jgi:hypothetical protein